MTMQSLSSIDPYDRLHDLACDYLAEPRAHEALTSLVWGGALDAMKKELLGSIRSKSLEGARSCRVASTCDRMCREEHHYLNEAPRFTHDTVERQHPVMMGKDLPIGHLDLYMRGGWSFRYHRVVTHVDRPRNADRSWTGTIDVSEQHPDVFEADDRSEFEIGVFVMTRPTPLVNIAAQARLYRQVAPGLRLVLVWAAASTWGPSNWARQNGITLVRPGRAFDAFCEQSDTLADSEA